jgi:hypothetical protein
MNIGEGSISSPSAAPNGAIWVEIPYYPIQDGIVTKRERYIHE